MISYRKQLEEPMVIDNVDKINDITNDGAVLDSSSLIADTAAGETVKMLNK